MEVTYQVPMCLFYGNVKECRDKPYFIDYILGDPTHREIISNLHVSISSYGIYPQMSITW